jgi:AraC-like DNA-binding protein
VLAATSEVRIGTGRMRSTLVFERAVRGTVILRDRLVFDTRFAAAAGGGPEPVGHVFMLPAGRLVSDRGEVYRAPCAFVMSDGEIERRPRSARTFRTDGDRVHVIQLRVPREHLRAPIGLTEGPLDLGASCWDAAQAMIEGAPRSDAGVLARLLVALAGANVVTAALPATLIADEPERFRRLWSALQPLYETYGATASLKQLAASLGMSMRQVGRDAKEMSAAFGIGGGYRDALLVLRLRVAVLLLGAHDGSVAEVARAVGYGSPIALARAFRDAELPAPSLIQAELHDPAA